MAKVPVNSIRAGNVIEYNGRLYAAMKVQHVNPGKGGAFVNLEARALKEGNKLQERFRSGETVELVRIDAHDCTYLYKDADGFHFMNKENYEQFTMQAEEIGVERAPFLQDGMEVVVSMFETTPVGIEIPKSVTLAIVEADAVVKGQTASSSYKPAMLENGVRILVPPHVASGTRVVVNTETGEYVERAKD
ncbi:MAG: elongation factor P [Rhodospirillales bacterium]|nr:elongation factor P [Rhodospirillales bacterium]